MSGKFTSRGGEEDDCSFNMCWMLEGVFGFQKYMLSLVRIHLQKQSKQQAIVRRPFFVYRDRTFHYFDVRFVNLH